MVNVSFFGDKCLKCETVKEREVRDIMLLQTICQKAGREFVFFAKEFHKLVPTCVRFGVNQCNVKSSPRVCYLIFLAVKTSSFYES